MVRCLVACAMVSALSGCATILPLSQQFDMNEESPPSGTFDRCSVGYYLAGMAIDAIIVGGDVMIGEEWNLYDGLVVVPLGLDALVATSVMIDCVRDN